MTNNYKRHFFVFSYYLIPIELYSKFKQEIKELENLKLNHSTKEFYDKQNKFFNKYSKYIEKESEN